MLKDKKFHNRCVEGIREFVQTAVVIDNEAYLEKPEVSHGEPSVAKRASGSVVEPDPVTSAQAEGVRTDVNIAGHSLDVKALTDAFHKVEIVCGVYKPTSGDDTVTLATKAACNADLVVLDWLLDETRSSATAKEIVKSIFIGDSQKNGRLRLVAVYTGEPNLKELAKELDDELKADARDGLRGFELSSEGCSLQRSDAKLSEFASVTQGLLSNFAVSAVASVRRAAHHIVATFKREMDGAYLSHRIRLRQPDDAMLFAAELVTAEIGNAIALDDTARRRLSSEVIDDWVDHVAVNHERVFTNHGKNSNVPSDLIKELARVGFSGVEENKKNGLSKYIEGLFFSTLESSWPILMEFARITYLRAEPNGRTPLPEAWMPMLTLGTVIKLVGSKPRELPSPYLVCVQPLCHSVGFKTETYFPFQTATIPQKPTDPFNLVVREEDTLQRDLLVGWKPRDAVGFRFNPDPTYQQVRAVKEGSRYVFRDTEDRSFLWLGDIKTDRAQRSASELASHIHTIGVDEFEWLREGAKEKDKKIELGWRPSV